MTPSAAAAQEPIPPNLLVYIKIQRLLQNMRILKGQTEQENISTDAEALTYIMTFSFDVPLSMEWTKIYIHLFRDYCKWIHITPPDFTEEAIHLSEYEAGMLHRLKSWICTKSINAFKEKLRKTATEKRMKETNEQRRLEEDI